MQPPLPDLTDTDSEDRAWHVLDIMGSPAALRRLGVGKHAVSEFFWRLTAHEWSGFDAIPHDEFRRLFARHRAAWSPQCMSGADLGYYTFLPDKTNVYRGQDASAPAGLSWTLDQDIAAEFARGHRGIHNPSPVILKRRIRKSDIAFIVLDREEDEVVLFEPPGRPIRHVKPATPSAVTVP